MTEKKVCNKCEFPKFKTEFAASPVNKDGLVSYCNPCRIEYNKNYRKNYTRSSEVRFSCTPEMKITLENIINNLGIDSTTFFRKEFIKIINSYPKKMKLSPTKF